MSLPFSNTSTHKGIIQEIERTIYGWDATARISGNATLLAQWTAKVNMALDKALAIIFEADGTWQFDDSGHSKHPIIKTNIVSGQNDYSFTVDEQSNLILDIYKVAILQSATATLYEEIIYEDQQKKNAMVDTVSETTATGVPYSYDKTGSALFLDPSPSYAATSGLKVYISREGSYFATSDTTKMAGFAGLFHEYLPAKACYDYAVEHGLPNVNGLRARMLELEQGLIEHYSRRAKDERSVMSPKKINYI